MKICISAESTIDLPKEILNEYDIKVVPFTVLLGEKSVFDGEMPPEDIFAYVEENKILPKTSAVNEFQFEEHFKKQLESYDAVIHFSLSSGISCACDNAKVVAKKMKNVYVIDTKSLSTGIALLAIYGRKLANKGLEPEEIVRRCTARIPSVQASFVINTLQYLHKGGRCSGVAKFAAALFRIKPQIIVEDGMMHPGKKYHGKIVPIVEDYCRDTLDEFNSPDLSIAFVTHTQADDAMREVAYKALKDRGFKKIYDTTAGATISSHCGPKTIGILYINDGLNEE